MSISLIAGIADRLVAAEKISTPCKRGRPSDTDEMLIISLSYKRVRTSVAAQMFFRSVCSPQCLLSNVHI